MTSSNLHGCADGAELVLTEVFAGAHVFSVNLGDRIHFDAEVPATVAAGDNTVDVALRRGATLTVSMVEGAGGAVADGCVDLAKLGETYGFSGNTNCSDWGSTPGTVVVGPLEAGTYQVFADPRDDALGMQWVGATGGTGDRDAALRVTVAAGDQATLPAVRFDRAGTIRGKVTDAATGAPVPWACVWVAALPTFFGDGCPAGTGEDGTYTIPGVGPYAWPVEFFKQGYQWRWSGNAVNRHEATPVTVRPGKSVAANIKLRAGGGTLTGTLRDASGHSVSGTVLVVDAVSGEAVQFGGYADGSDSPYTITNIAPQQVKIAYRAERGRRGWVGGTDLASAQVYQIKNNRTLTVNVTVA
ncbi:carboxypeptidase-like regulatory domain-containing protein [Dactylosporangium sp. NPDC048998]|uniref:carboxypeptidase-like regulatory domain-containing protein n=1 Tax=Dactylosporangium sp. NPDC048998 TaxID=3363976 RepID=UPI00371513A7